MLLLSLSVSLNIFGVNARHGFFNRPSYCCSATVSEPAFGGQRTTRGSPFCLVNMALGLLHIRAQRPCCSSLRKSIDGNLRPGFGLSSRIEFHGLRVDQIGDQPNVRLRERRALRGRSAPAALLVRSSRPVLQDLGCSVTWQSRRRNRSAPQTRRPQH